MQLDGLPVIFSSVRSLTPTLADIFSADLWENFPKVRITCLLTLVCFRLFPVPVELINLCDFLDGKGFLTMFSSASASLACDMLTITKLASISGLQSFSYAAILRLPQISSFLSVITMGCKSPCRLMLSTKGPISPRSFLNLGPILMSAIGL